MQKRLSWLQRLDRLYLPKRDQVIYEGIRLATWNLAYIIVSLVVSIGLSYLSYWFPKVSLILSLTLSISVAAVAGVLYFILWIRFANHFSFFVKKSRVLKTFILSIIGVIPNFWIFFSLPKLFQQTYGYNADNCSIFLMFWMGMLTFFMVSLSMPLVSLIGVAMHQTTKNQ